jgi:hypothetical protein
LVLNEQLQLKVLVAHKYLLVNYCKQRMIDQYKMDNNTMNKNHEEDMMVHNNMIVMNNMNPYFLEINTNELEN